MVDVNISIMLDATGLHISSDVTLIGVQYTNKETRFLFDKPGELQDQQMLLMFTTSWQKVSFEPMNIGVATEFPLVSLFTQGESLTIAVAIDTPEGRLVSNRLQLSFELALPPAITVLGMPDWVNAYIKVLGAYDTYEQLVAAHPAGKEGDAYIVDKQLFIWTI